MHKILSIVLCALLSLAVAFATVPYSYAQGGVSLLWSDPMEVNDVAVSKDGNYLAAVNDIGVYFFASDNPNPLWWYPAATIEDFSSVAISADGNYVVAGNSSLGEIYYWKDATTLADPPNPPPTWISEGLYGPIERRALDMSDDGEYVVVGGTGTDVFYFAGCTGRLGPGQPWTWRDRITKAVDVFAVDMSSDGRYVVAGGLNGTYPGFVVYYKDADQLSGAPDPDWDAWSRIVDIVRDVAVSDDGYAVVAVADTIDDHALYYWADATNLFDDPDATWTNDGSYGSVDMSSDGNEVVAGTTLGAPCGVHFWSNARFLSGLRDSSWNRHEGEQVYDLAISDDGGIIAATTLIGDFSEYKAYFFTSDGSLIGEFTLQSPGEVVSMSGDGSIVAIGGPSIDSLYVFRIIVTPPVGGELVPTPILNTIMLLMLVAIIPTLVIGLRLIKR